MDVTELLESEYLGLEFIKNSPSKVGIILSSGTQEAGKDGKGKNLQVLIEIDGKKKYWKINKGSLRLLVSKYGLNSEGFVAKQISFGSQIVNGKECILGTPL